MEFGRESPRVAFLDREIEAQMTVNGQEKKTLNVLEKKRHSADLRDKRIPVKNRLVVEGLNQDNSMVELAPIVAAVGFVLGVGVGSVLEVAVVGVGVSVVGIAIEGVAAAVVVADQLFLPKW